MRSLAIYTAIVLIAIVLVLGQSGLNLTGIADETVNGKLSPGWGINRLVLQYRS